MHIIWLFLYFCSHANPLHHCQEIARSSSLRDVDLSEDPREKWAVENLNICFVEQWVSSPMLNDALDFLVVTKLDVRSQLHWQFTKGWQWLQLALESKESKVLGPLSNHTLCRNDHKSQLTVRVKSRTIPFPEKYSACTSFSISSPFTIFDHISANAYNLTVLFEDVIFRIARVKNTLIFLF